MFSVQLVVAQVTTITCCYFGVANTGIAFSKNNCGLTTIVFEQELLVLRSKIMLELKQGSRSG